MKRAIKIDLISVVIFFFINLGVFASGQTDEPVIQDKPAMMDRSSYLDEELEVAVFAGGCFWGVEGVYEQIYGVVDVVSGYSGGEAETANYYMVGSGSTGHAESVEIVFDPNLVSYETLLEVFFTVAHNPTELNFQGPDRGTEYRSAVFYTSNQQKMAVQELISQYEQNKVYNKPIVTEITELEAFYPAEDYHQDFMRLNPDHPYIVYWDVPKVEELKARFPELLSPM